MGVAIVESSLLELLRCSASSMDGEARLAGIVLEEWGLKKSAMVRFFAGEGIGATIETCQRHTLDSADSKQLQAVASSWRERQCKIGRDKEGCAGGDVRVRSTR